MQISADNDGCCHLEQRVINSCALAYLIHMTVNAASRLELDPVGEWSSSLSDLLAYEEIREAILQ